MKRVRPTGGAAAFLFSLIVLPGWAEPPEGLVVRSELKPKSEMLVGQKLVLTIDVLAKDLWASLPKLPPVDLSGAVVVASPDQGIRLTETIDGDTYIGQRYEWWCFPQRPGALSLPPIELRVHRKPLGIGDPEPVVSAATERMEVTVNLPPGVEAGDELICVNEITSGQQWSPQRLEITAGDGITRSITRTVSGSPAMLLSPLPFPSASGFSVFRKQPQVDDRFDRGDLTGRRLDRATYVFEEAGEYEIPAIQYRWWNLKTGALEVEEFPGETVRVAASPAVAETPAGGDGEASQRWNLGWNATVLIPLTLVVATLIYFRRKVASLWAQWRSDRQASESAHFRRFRDAAQSGNPVTTLATLTRWWDAAEGAAPRLDQFFQQYCGPAGESQLQQLYQAVDQGRETCNGKTLLSEVTAGRSNWRRAASRSDAKNAESLPPLNSLSARQRLS